MGFIFGSNPVEVFEVSAGIIWPYLGAWPFEIPIIEIAVASSFTIEVGLE